MTSSPVLLSLLFLTLLVGCNLQDPVSQSERACPQGCVDASGITDAGITTQADMSKPTVADLPALDASSLDAHTQSDISGAPSDLAMTPDASCDSETDAAFCQRLVACGVLKRLDKCGMERQVNCGARCGQGELCQENVCVCPKPRCSQTMCGVVTTACASIDIDCRGCEVPPTQVDVCWESTCMNNTCSYMVKPDQECSARRCTNNELTLPRTCGPKGECAGPSLKKSCGRYSCDGDRCRTQCTAESHCAPGFSCDITTGYCLP